MASSASQPIVIRVLIASTGVTYKISLFQAELTVANIRNHLAAAVPISDQILLLGPPYKVPKDSNFQSEDVLKSLRLGDAEDDPLFEDTDSEQGKFRSILSRTERTGACRLFLFSKQALSENAPEPPVCHLEPLAVTLPTEAPGTSPLNMTQSAMASQPLHQALVAYERQFMLHLSQGQVLADAADLRVAACKKCVQEQAIMARSLRAAVSNLSDHYNAATRTRSDFSSHFQSKITAHASLLQRFESILVSLGTISLHPSLVQIARGSGRIMETLLDTVPVEREKAWAQQCQTSHQRLVTLFSELESAFSELKSPAARETNDDFLAEDEINKLTKEVYTTAENIRIDQSKKVEQLTADHGQILKIIMEAVGSDGDEGQEEKAQSAFTPLQQISSRSKEIIPTMQAQDHVLVELTARVAEAKTAAMKRMKIRLREVSLAQSSIQRVLSSVGVLRDALSQQCENMIHLEHVAELPASYKDFLSELRRRRAYGLAVSSQTNAMMERLAAMRTDEVKSRERFLRGPGRHLMPPFYEIFVPTLATPPPLFTPQMPTMVELDTLPDVESTLRETDTSMVQAPGEGGISSASSLTAESQLPSADKVFNQGSTEEARHQQEQLIVSADENSGAEDVLMDPVSAASQDAERKALAYENAVLRQQLERLGGKPPKVYVDEARVRDGSSEDIEAVRKELKQAKSKIKTREIELEAVKKSLSKDNDKISHSQFDVGDVALFMPTGRGSGGKRTYLAFHTNCPHRYLATDGIKGNPDFVLGRIVMQEELVAGEMGTEANPFGLHVGTKFFLLTVEQLKF